MTQTISIAMVGLGNVGQRVMQLLLEKEAYFKQRYDLAFRLVAASDSSGAAIAAAPERGSVFNLPGKGEGLDMREGLRLKAGKHGVATIPKLGRSGQGASEMLEKLEFGALLEMSPTNLKDGEPGLSAVDKA